jgi:hypothetical protein
VSIDRATFDLVESIYTDRKQDVYQLQKMGSYLLMTSGIIFTILIALEKLTSNGLEPYFFIYAIFILMASILASALILIPPNLKADKHIDSLLTDDEIKDNFENIVNRVIALHRSSIKELRSSIRIRKYTLLGSAIALAFAIYLGAGSFLVALLP